MERERCGEKAGALKQMYGGRRHRSLVKGGLGHSQAVAVAPRVRGDDAGLPGEQISGATARYTLIWVVFALTLR